jgi:hypothetical protein
VGLPRRCDRWISGLFRRYFCCVRAAPGVAAKQLSTNIKVNLKGHTPLPQPDTGKWMDSPNRLTVAWILRFKALQWNCMYGRTREFNNSRHSPTGKARFVLMGWKHGSGRWQDAPWLKLCGLRVYVPAESSSLLRAPTESVCPCSTAARESELKVCVPARESELKVCVPR